MADENLVFPEDRPRTLPAGSCDIVRIRYRINGNYTTTKFETTGWDIIVNDVSSISEVILQETDYGDVILVQLRDEVFDWAAENLGYFKEMNFGSCLIVRFASEEDAVAFMLRYG